MSFDLILRLSRAEAAQPSDGLPLFGFSEKGPCGRNQAQTNWGQDGRQLPPARSVRLSAFPLRTNPVTTAPPFCSGCRLLVSQLMQRAAGGQARWRSRTSAAEPYG